MHFMQTLSRTRKLYQCLFANKNFPAPLNSFCAEPPLLDRPFLGNLSSSCLGLSKGPKYEYPSTIRFNSFSASALAVEKQVIAENEVQPVELLRTVDDIHGGVKVEMEEPMDSKAFASLLRASLSQWRQQGKRGVWLKLPIQFSHLVGAAVKEGFSYHHAEPDYLMLVYWIPKTTNMLPANASHRVSIGAFVMNSKREVLVVQESNGKFKGKGLWKLPTGAVDEGEDISAAAVREVKEETGIDTNFVEVLAFRQSHNSFFRKSDMFFVCMLQPISFDIQKQDLEIAAAQWMQIEDYAAQPFVKRHDIFNYIAKICLAKSDKNYTGFSPINATTSSGKSSYLYLNSDSMNQLLTSGNQ